MHKGGGGRWIRKCSKMLGPIHFKRKRQQKRKRSIRTINKDQRTKDKLQRKFSLSLSLGVKAPQHSRTFLLLRSTIANQFFESFVDKNSRLPGFQMDYLPSATPAKPSASNMTVNHYSHLSFQAKPHEMYELASHNVFRCMSFELSSWMCSFHWEHF